MSKAGVLKWAALVAVLLLVAGCAAGENNEWTDADPAGFFAGLWHGALLLVALVVSFFTDQVTIYEISNNGVAYNIGYVLGIFIVYGGGTKVSLSRPRKARAKDREEWDRIGEKIEAKVKSKLQAFLDEEEDPDWKELGEKFERKLKKHIREWLKEDGEGGGKSEE